MDDSGEVTAFDLLLVINGLALRQLCEMIGEDLPRRSGTRTAHSWDVTANSSNSAFDTLRVINQLQVATDQAESEATADTTVSGERLVVDRFFDHLATEELSLLF